jgi:tRNA(fMet)-specific endonuclease VapC
MLDTNVCIGVMNGKIQLPNAKAPMVLPSQMAISEIVRYELEFGICKSSQQKRNRSNLEHLLAYVQVLPFAEAQARESAKVRYELLEKGQPVGPYDMLIAAHARSISATLITHNTREFNRIKGLAIEDWE